MDLDVENAAQVAVLLGLVTAREGQYGETVGRLLDLDAVRASGAALLALADRQPVTVDRRDHYAAAQLHARAVDIVDLKLLTELVRAGLQTDHAVRQHLLPARQRDLIGAAVAWQRRHRGGLLGLLGLLGLGGCQCCTPVQLFAELAPWLRLLY